MLNHHSRNTKCTSCGWRGPVNEWMEGNRCPQCGITELQESPHRMLFYSTRPDIPHSFRNLHRLIMLPIFIWPLIFYGSIFLFDSGNSSKATLWFLAIICYPLYLFALRSLSFRLYHTNKPLAYIITFIPVTAYLIMLLIVLFP